MANGVQGTTRVVAAITSSVAFALLSADGTNRCKTVDTMTTKVLTALLKMTSQMTIGSNNKMVTRAVMSALATLLINVPA